MEEVYRHIEPSVINVRSGKNEALQEEIIKNLSTNHGYVNLDVTQLTSYEMESTDLYQACCRTLLLASMSWDLGGSDRLQPTQLLPLVLSTQTGMHN